MSVGGGKAIRGSRVGGGPMGEAERGTPAPRQLVRFYCAKGHETALTFATGAEVPETWDCPTCGFQANTDSENPPPPAAYEPYKTHLAYVKERRSDDEAEELLDEALSTLRKKRKSGDVIF